ncbi:transcription factor IIIB 50 kDa subunit [Aplochiton taeniatus]
MEACGLTCPDCGSSNIVDDAHYSQSQLVCEDCGSVVSEGLLTTHRDELQGTDLFYSQTTAVDKQPCRNQIKGLQRVRSLCRILKINREMETIAEGFYTQAYDHTNFIRVSLQKKEALAGCCVLVSCRLRSWPIAMGTISSLLEADPKFMGIVYKEMVKALKIEAHAAEITDLVESHCQDYKITLPHVPEELAENTKDLTKRAVDLVELSAETWIVTGRHALPIIMASIFLAWQSLKPTKGRLKFTLQRFCKLAKVTKNKKALLRVAEMKEVLCKLGKELPWLGTDVTDDNVMLLTAEILENRNALLRRAMKKHKDTLSAELQPSSEQSNLPSPVGETPSLASTLGDQTRTEASVKPHTEKPLPQKDVTPKTSEEEEELETDKANQVGQAAVPNWSKRLLFAPPCVRHAKIRRVCPPMVEVTGDEEISDSEIDTYIRTPQEMRDFAYTNKLLSSSYQKS